MLVGSIASYVFLNIGLYHKVLKKSLLQFKAEHEVAISSGYEVFVIKLNHAEINSVFQSHKTQEKNLSLLSKVSDFAKIGGCFEFWPAALQNGVMGLLELILKGERHILDRLLVHRRKILKTF